MTINKTDSYTEIYVTDADGWITESYPTHFHHFYKRKILAGDESAEDYKEVTTDEKLSLDKSDATWVRPPQYLIDVANQDPYGKFNEDTGYFELNGLTDITYRQFMDIVTAGSIQSKNAEFFYYRRNIRTNLNMQKELFWNEEVSMDGVFYQCDNLEVFSLRNLKYETIPIAKPADYVYHYFHGADKLKAILGILDFGSYSQGDLERTFSALPSLESIRIKNIRCNMNFEYFPKLDYESVKYIIKNATPRENIVISFRSGIYAKLTGDETHPAYNQLSVEEKIQWTSILNTATSMYVHIADSGYY